MNVFTAEIHQRENLQKYINMDVAQKESEKKMLSVWVNLGST